MYPVTGPDAGYSGGTGAISGLSDRTQENVTEELKAHVGGSPGWNLSSFNVYEFLRAGISLPLSIIEGVIQHMLPFGLGNFVDLEHAFDTVETAFTKTFNFLGDLNPLDPDFNIADAAIAFIQLILSPVNLLANLVGGFIPQFQIPGIDASKIISGVFSNSFFPGLLRLFNKLFGGFLGGIEPDSQANEDDVGEATTGQSQSVAAISAALAALQAQLEDSNPDTVVVEDDFEYDAPPDILKWSVTTVGSGATNAVSADGHSMNLNTASGAGVKGYRFLYIGPSHTSVTDDMTVKIVLGDYLTPTVSGTSPYIELNGRQHATADSRVVLRLYKKSFELFSLTSGTKTSLSGGTVSLPSIPGTGSIVTFDLGTTDGHRYFRISINGSTWNFFDSTSASQLGSAYRERGFTMMGGNNVAYFVTYALSCGNIAHWASRNAAA